MTNRPHIPPAIAALLSRLRLRIRAYVWLEGLTLLIAAVGALFWLGLAFDWVIEPPAAVRVVLLLFAAAGLGWLCYRSILRRVFVPLSDVSLALLLERYGKTFGDSLITAVELSTTSQQLPEYNEEMLTHTSAEAEQRVAQVRLADVFNFRPLVRNGLAALVMVASIGLFAYFSPDAFGFYGERLRLSSERWPRSTRLVVEGFPADVEGIRKVKVAKGSNYTLTIQADNSARFEIPSRVEVLYTLADGSRGRGDAKRIGNAVPGLDAFQEFQFTFENLHDTHTFDVVGRDAGVALGLRDERIRGLQLEVVDSPGVEQKLIDVKYPAYMHRTPATLEATAAMQLPRGVELTLRARSNKKLVHVRIEDSALEQPVEIELPPKQSNRQEFSYHIPRLEADRVLFFSLTDEDGITTADQDRDRLSILAMPDEPPQVTVRLQGIGEAITPSASVPLVGKVVDDYGVGRWWFEHRSGEAAARQTPLSSPPSGRQTLEVADALDVRPLELQPKQTLAIWLKAEDEHNLADGPHAGQSTRFELQIVTPEDLRGILDRDELRLRQRFEAVYEEMLRTRDLIARIEYEPAASSGEPSDVLDQEKSDGGEKSADASESANSASDAEKPALEDAAELAERAAARRRLQLMKALHYIERGGHDTLSVATGFEEIFAQMVNNRIDSVDARQRLVSEIAEPLKSIGGPEMKELSARLEKLRTMSPAETSGPSEWRAALAQTDQVLVEMKQILDRMQQIGNFNELVETLRSILKDQDQISLETKQLRTKSTRNLLED